MTNVIDKIVAPLTPEGTSPQGDPQSHTPVATDPNPVPKTAYLSQKTKYFGGAGTPFPLGYPPVELYFSNQVLNSTMPVMFVVPGEGHFKAGLDLFVFSSLMNKFVGKMKTDYGITIPSQYSAIPIAFTPDSIPGIQLNNEYGASFLQNITDVASPMLGQLGQIAGGTNATLTGLIKELGTESGKMLGGKMGEVVAGGAVKGANILEGIPKALTGLTGGRGAELLSSAGKIVNQVLMGARVDFPKVWLGSSFTGPVSINVRLYNTNQVSKVAYDARIINPLRILLSLAAPISDEDYVYRWPYICQIYCHGLFFWKMAAIVGMSVQPAPENQMSWDQRPSMVDVRIDFQPLHSVMLNRKSSNLPNVGNYVDQLEKKRDPPKLWGSPPGAPVYEPSIPRAPMLGTLGTTGTPTNTVDPTIALNPPKRSTDEQMRIMEELNSDAATKAIAAYQEKIKAEDAAKAKADAENLQKAKEIYEGEQVGGTLEGGAIFTKEMADAKALQDFAREENLATFQAGGPTTFMELEGKAGSASVPESEAQKVTGNITDPNYSYQQTTDGAPPPAQPGVPKEISKSAAGTDTSVLAGVSSKLSAVGSSIVGGVGGLPKTIIDAASDRARRISEAVKASGTTPPSTTNSQPAVTKSIPVDETRKAEVFPTSTEETTKAQTNAAAVASQENMQSMASETAQENQEYNRKLQILNDLLQKTTDPATRTWANNRVTSLNGNHTLNLQAIKTKYTP